MNAQTTLVEELSAAETDALSRFVRDLRVRMNSVVQLLGERGSSRAASLAESVQEDLAALEEELAQTGQSS
ncbi:MAG: hypothetical protein JO022_03495 [Acidobacteriaceae bacterium]|nr:hypothetical protein [Acidobacteriaceae bacterium]